MAIHLSLPGLKSAITLPALALVMAGCAGTIPAATPQQRAPVAVRAPQVMSAAGLENVIGASAATLTRRLGQPRLDGLEGDVRKLQFAGRACVLDIYLYPLQPGAEPVATHVEARQRDSGTAVDRAQCLREVERR
ncbi:MAG: hypothetical protein ACXIT4_02275 [Erythrobacter sp.]